MHGARGVTITELLVVLVLIALVVAVFAAPVGRIQATTAARRLAETLTVLRWASVSRSVNVVARLHDGAVVARWSYDGFGCTVAGPAGWQTVTDVPRGVTIKWPATALAFGSDGRPRSCSGSGVGNATIRVIDRAGREAAVIVSALGRVRWESR